MIYARIENNQVVEYPITDIYQRYPNVSFSQPFTVDQCPDEIVPVYPKNFPEYDPAVQNLEEGTPQYINNKWHQTWNVLPYTQETVPQRRQRETNLFAQYSQIITQKLDNFAKIKGYDNIATACTYATSTVPKYKLEGERCVLMRDTYWSYLENLLTQIQSGAVAPQNIQQFQENLPALTWPE